MWYSEDPHHSLISLWYFETSGTIVSCLRIISVPRHQPASKLRGCSALKHTVSKILAQTFTHQNAELSFLDRRNTSSISLSSTSSSPLTSPKRLLAHCSTSNTTYQSSASFRQKCHHHHRDCMGILTCLPTLTRPQTMSPSSNGCVV
jgi:hypothetical protein